MKGHGNTVFCLAVLFFPKDFFLGLPIVGWAGTTQNNVEKELNRNIMEHPKVQDC
jgi:hypothetical protein